MNKTNAIVILLFLISFAFNFIASLEPIKWWDETVYANLGYWLQNNPLNYSFHGWGDRVLSWWPLAGFRAPLLPYIIALADAITNSNQFFVDLIVPFFGAAGAVVLYFLARQLFDERTAIYSAAFLAFLPIYVQISGKILTDIPATTLIIASFLFFWLGFEKKIIKFKYLTGFFAALSVLARYTSLVIIPTFFIYLAVRNRNLKFLKDKHLSITFLIFLLALSPLFVYGYLNYGTPLGALIHGWQGASYWGGVQPWYFFLQNSPAMFSAVIILFVIGLYFMLVSFKNEPNRLFVLCWFITLLLVFSSLQHKEDRFFLPLFPAVCMISAFGLRRLKKYEQPVFVAILFITIVTTIGMIYYSNISNDSKPVWCFYQATNFLSNTDNNSVVFNDNSPIVYYYTHRESDFYTDNNGVKDLDSIIKHDFQNRSAYVLWTLYGAPTEVRQIFGNHTDFKTVFSCPEDGSLAQIYKFVGSHAA